MFRIGPRRGLPTARGPYADLRIRIPEKETEKEPEKEKGEHERENRRLRLRHRSLIPLFPMFLRKRATKIRAQQ